MLWVTGTYTIKLLCVYIYIYLGSVSKLFISESIEILESVFTFSEILRNFNLTIGVSKFSIFKYV